MLPWRPVYQCICECDLYGSCVCITILVHLFDVYVAAVCDLILKVLICTYVCVVHVQLYFMCVWCMCSCIYVCVVCVCSCIYVCVVHVQLYLCVCGMCV